MAKDRSAGERWATLLALPEGDRGQRERPFWSALIASFGWRRVLDAGCGGGFHMRMLSGLGVDTVGLDSALAPLAQRRQRRTAVADLLATPFRPSSCDAVMSLGNTFSLLPDRRTQRLAITALGALLRPGGVLLLQGEDVAANAGHEALARLRDLKDGRLHLRVFRRRGRRVEMLVGLVPAQGDAELEVATLLPTTGNVLLRLGQAGGLEPVELPATPPGGASTWWLALRRPPG